MFSSLPYTSLSPPFSPAVQATSQPNPGIAREETKRRIALRRLDAFSFIESFALGDERKIVALMFDVITNHESINCQQLRHHSRGCNSQNKISRNVRDPFLKTSIAAWQKKNHAAELPVFQPLPSEKTPTLSCCSFLKFWSCAFMVVYLSGRLPWYFHMYGSWNLNTNSNAESPEFSNSHHHGNLPPPNTAATIEAWMPPVHATLSVFGRSNSMNLKNWTLPKHTASITMI